MSMILVLRPLYMYVHAIYTKTFIAQLQNTKTACTGINRSSLYNILSSIEVKNDVWTVYMAAIYEGSSLTLSRGEYINNLYIIICRWWVMWFPMHLAKNAITYPVYDVGHFQGKTLPFSEATCTHTSKFTPLGFSNKWVFSIEVELWTVYEYVNYEGYKLTLGVGKYFILSQRKLVIQSFIPLCVNYTATSSWASDLPLRKRGRVSS